MQLNPLLWFTKEVKEVQNEATYTLKDDAVLQAFYGALALVTSSGIRITQESSFRSVAVLACLIVRAETFSALPVRILRDAGAGVEQEDRTHAAYRLLTIAPNELMTAGEFWRWKQIHEDVTGNAYARIERTRSGALAQIWPLYGPRPDLNIAGGQAFYRYQGDDLTPRGDYLAGDILHWKGPVLRTPFEGASLIDLASEAIGVSLGSEQFFARLLGNGAHFPGYLEKEEALSDQDMEALTQQLAGHSGLLATGRLRIFDRGLKYKQNPMSMRDAQLTEQERLQLQKICSIFRMPLAMVQDLTHGTYTNSEQQDLWLAKHTITPICVDTERVCRHRLFYREPTVRAKWNLDGLLRGDYKTRSEGDAILTRGGILLRNEARSHYDLNPIPGLDRPLAELNMGVVSEDGTITSSDRGQGAAPTAALLAPLLADARDDIRCRYADDEQNGRSREDSIIGSVAKLAPITQAFALAGEHFDALGFVLASLPGDTRSTLSEEGSLA